MGLSRVLYLSCEDGKEVKGRFLLVKYYKTEDTIFIPVKTSLSYIISPKKGYLYDY